MKTYVGLSAALLCFSFAGFAGDAAVKKGRPVAANGVAGIVSECDFVEGNLVSNCGFESGDFTGWTQSGDLGFTGVDASSAHSGSFGAFLGPVDDQGMLTQIVPTKAGGTYTLSLWLSNDGGTPNNFNIFWDGTLIDGFIDSDAFPYFQLTYDGLMASSDGTELTFSFLQVPAYYRLDDISVVASSKSR